MSEKSPESARTPQAKVPERLRALQERSEATTVLAEALAFQKKINKLHDDVLKVVKDQPKGKPWSDEVAAQVKALVEPVAREYSRLLPRVWEELVGKESDTRVIGVKGVDPCGIAIDKKGQLGVQ
jgi:hypothetical protein